MVTLCPKRTFVSQSAGIGETSRRLPDGVLKDGKVDPEVSGA